MSSTNTTDSPRNNGMGAMSDLFTRMWSDFASQMRAHGLSPEQGGADQARQMRDVFFASWTDACDKYMRSDEFRRMMRESMQAAIDLRRQFNEQMGAAQHLMQGASRQDIDRLAQSVDGLERRVNDTFTQIMDRLDTLTRRLDAIEKPSARAAGRAAAASVKKKKPKRRRDR